MAKCKCKVYGSKKAIGTICNRAIDFITKDYEIVEFVSSPLFENDTEVFVIPVHSEK